MKFIKFCDCLFNCQYIVFFSVNKESNNKFSVTMIRNDSQEDYSHCEIFDSEDEARERLNLLNACLNTDILENALKDDYLDSKLMKNVCHE